MNDELAAYLNDVLLDETVKFRVEITSENEIEDFEDRNAAGPLGRRFELEAELEEEDVERDVDIDEEEEELKEDKLPPRIKYILFNCKILNYQYFTKGIWDNLAKYFLDEDEYSEENIKIIKREIVSHKGILGCQLPKDQYETFKSNFELVKEETE